MRNDLLVAIGLIAAALIISAPLSGQQVTKQDIEGVTNYHRLETTIACAGAIKVEAVPELKKMGFASIINLRQDSEPGANVEAEAAAAKSVGMLYYHIPFDGQNPDPAAADKFIDAITSKGGDPAFIHCSGGNRAATMWMIKRLVVDHWDADRAWKEASELGMTSTALKQFAIDYSQTHKR